MMGVWRYSWGAVKMFLLVSMWSCANTCCVICCGWPFFCAHALFDCAYDMDHVSEINLFLFFVYYYLSLGQVFVAVTKRESCIYFQRKLHLCAVSCIYAHIWLWKTWNNLFWMQKSKKLRKVTCKNRKSCKSCMQKSKKLQKVACKNRKSCKNLQYKIPGNSSKHWIIYILSI